MEAQIVENVVTRLRVEKDTWKYKNDRKLCLYNFVKIKETYYRCLYCIYIKLFPVSECVNLCLYSNFT